MGGEDKENAAGNPLAGKPSSCTWERGHFAMQRSGFGLQRKKGQVEM